MSNHDTDRLSQALRQRSGDMAGSHLDLDAVKGRARGIRRRRRAVGGVAVAAVVLAISAPIGLGGTDLLRGEQQLPADQPTVVETPTREPTPEPTGRVEIDASSAPRGEDPAITYLTGRTLHRTGQTDLRLPAAYWAVAPYADGWVGISIADGTTTFLDAEGRPTQEPYPGASAAVSADGQRLATVLYAGGGGDVDLQLWRTADANPGGGYGSHVVAFDAQAALAGFVGPETVAYNLTTDGPQGATVTPYVASWYSGEEPRELDGLIEVLAASETNGTVSGMTEVDQPAGTACYAVVDVATSERKWRTCDYALEKFSADGRYVLGTDAYADGVGGNQVAILDAETGEVVADFATRDGAYHQNPAWESDTTVLVPIYQDDAWYLLRLRPDGTVERTLDAARTGDYTGSPWRFEVTP